MSSAISRSCSWFAALSVHLMMEPLVTLLIQACEIESLFPNLSFKICIAFLYPSDGFMYIQH